MSVSRKIPAAVPPGEPKIQCPECHHEFLLSEAISQEYQQKLAEEAEIQKRRLMEEVAKEKAAIEQRARDAMAIQLKAQEEAMKGLHAQLAERAKAEADLLKLKHELELKQATMELDIQRRLDEQTAKVREEAQKLAVEEQSQKMVEKDILLKQLQRQIEDLKRSSENRSQQLQGEAFEQTVDSRLKALFPDDVIERIGKGKKGQDLLQEVRNPSGHSLGKISWEVKNTKNWEADWIPKTKDDKISRGAEIAVIVSVTLPKDIKGAAFRDGVWITDPVTLPIVAQAVRSEILAVSHARDQQSAGEAEASELLKYVTSSAFRDRVERIANTLATMSSAVTREENAMRLALSKRRQQITSISEQSMSVFGHLQGSIAPQMKQAPRQQLGDGSEVGEEYFAEDDIVDEIEADQEDGYQPEDELDDDPDKRRLARLRKVSVKRARMR